MDAHTDPAATVERAATNMGLSILKALPTGARMVNKTKPRRSNDFESFAANNSRVFQPTATFQRLSN